MSRHFMNARMRHEWLDGGYSIAIWPRPIRRIIAKDFDSEPASRLAWARIRKVKEQMVSLALHDRVLHRRLFQSSAGES